MGKKSKKAALEKAQQKLAKAQLALQVAQEKRAQAISKGEHEIERARQRAAARETKATTRVEKRATAEARAEATVLKLADKQETPHEGPGTVSPATVGGTMTPRAAADTLERETPQSNSGPIVVPESVEVITGNETENFDPDSNNSSSSTW